MDSKKSINPQFIPEERVEEGRKPDTAEKRKTRKILQLFGKAFSLMKVYPSENPAVINSLNAFADNLLEFLREYEELRIGVEESSFSYKGESLFAVEKRKKNLPFLFYKDGMRELSFHKRLTKEELLSFLQVVKEASDLPPEDSDIVRVLWEKNFINIRYFAIDEFLESDKTFYVEKDDIYEGMISLLPEDKQEIYERSMALGLQFGDEKEKGKKGIQLDNVTSLSQIPAIKENEIPEIESMLLRSREKSPLSELITLLFEILFLEEVYEKFSAILNVTLQCYMEFLHKGNFRQALSVAQKLKELKESLASTSEERTSLLEKALNRTKEDVSITRLKQFFIEGRIEDFDSYFQFLKFQGPGSAPIAALIWENMEYKFLRPKILAFLEHIGREDVTSLINLARMSKTSFLKEIIELLGLIGDKKAISFLETFIGHESAEIRKEAVKTLGMFSDEEANKIMIKFLSDEDGDVRTLIATKLKYSGDNRVLNLILHLARRNDFKKRDKAEKEAFLRFLASTQSDEVYPFFSHILKKSSLFSKKKMNETRLCAVSALASIATPEAVEILREGTKVKSKSIRTACQESLKDIAAGEESSKSMIG